MATISATAFFRHFQRVRLEAEAEPVAVTSHGEISGYFLSPSEFARYRTLLARERRALHPSELSDRWLEALDTVEMAPVHAPLDALMERKPPEG